VHNSTWLARPLSGAPLSTNENIMNLLPSSLSARITLGVLVMLLTGAATLLLVENAQHREIYLSERRADLAQDIEVETLRLSQAIHELRHDVLFLSNTPPVSGIVRATLNHGYDSRNHNTHKVWAERLQQIFSAFSRAHPEYYKIRYIGVADGGRELVRIDNRGGVIEITPPDRLQAKGDRDYFKFTQGLREGQVSFSEFNLSQELGVIEQPYRPTLRASTPVFTSSGEMFGIVVISLDVNSLMKLAVSNLRDTQTYVTNSAGQYLLHPDARHAFKFEFGSKEKITADFPFIETMFAPHAADYLPLQTAKPDGSLFAAKRIGFDPENPSRFLLLMHYLPGDKVAKQLAATPAPQLLYELLAMLLACLIILLALRRTFAPLKQLTAAADNIAAGEQHTRLPQMGSGEIGSLSSALNTMLAKLSQREQSLQKTQTNLVVAQQLAKVGSWEWDVRNNTATWSDETYRIFEIDKRDLSEHRKNFLDLIAPEDRIKVDRALSDALDGVKEYDIEYRIGLAGGRKKVIHALAKVTREMDGKAVVMLGTVQDITERKNNEARIERLSRAYRLLSRVNEAIMRADTEPQLFAAICNAATESGLFRLAWIGVLDESRLRVIPVASAGVEEGYTSKLNIRLDDERTGNGPIATALRTGRHVVCPDIENDPAMAPWRDEAIRRGYRSSAAFPFKKTGGVIGTVITYAAEAHFFTQDIIQLMQELVADISFALDVFAERTRREQAEDEVRQLNINLERRVAERTLLLEAANKELEAFSYSVSHDLRAPLRSIDGFSKLLMDTYQGRLDATAQDWLGRVRRASQHMGHLIDDMLQLSQVSRGELKRVQIDLGALAKNAVDDLRLAHPERQVRFIMQGDLNIYGDPSLMRIAINNLLGNAWKYTGKTTVAEIEFGACDISADTGVERAFFVRDNGAGFNMDYAHKLFAPFQRLHVAGEFEGTGIGLATVQRIIHRQHGKVWAEAEEGEGATFFFTLPQRNMKTRRKDGQ